MPTIKKGIMCEDENLQNKIYPYTQMDCVYDSDNSTTLDVVVGDIKENLMYVDEIGAYENVVPINADQLEGHDAAYFEGLSVGLPVNIDLLWNNESPASQFTAQTIQLDLSKYDFVYIVYKLMYSSTTTPLGVVNELASKGYNTSTFIGSAGYIWYRAANVNNDGVVFGDGKRYATYTSGTETTNNERLVPLHIYGIKANITDKTGA